MISSEMMRAGGGVDRHGQAEPDAGHRGVDADDLRPVESARAPPELPGLRAASVWMTSSISRVRRPSRTGSERPRAETTPAVTEPARPSGLPTATTSWPIRRASASPSVAGGPRPSRDLQDGEVGQWIRADHVEQRLGSVGELGDAVGGAGHHVRAGEHEAVRGERDA